MDKLIKEEYIEICKGCKIERDSKKQGYEWICQKCGRDEDTFQDAVKQTITRILIKE